jgi:signal transduction histidine kinase
MLRISWALVLAFVFAIGINAAMAADEYGTPAEAKAMLEKVVNAIKQDESKALQMISKSEDGFKEKDLYPFCAGPDGNFTAHPTLVGKSLEDLKDKSGKAFGKEIMSEAKEGKISEVTYMWPRPGGTEPVQKVAYVTKVKDQVCAVGYYK